VPPADGDSERRTTFFAAALARLTSERRGRVAMSAAPLSGHGTARPGGSLVVRARIRGRPTPFKEACRGTIARHDTKSHDVDGTSSPPDGHERPGDGGSPGVRGG
jgi:hypothetical protein